MCALLVAVRFAAPIVSLSPSPFKKGKASAFRGAICGNIGPRSNSPSTGYRKSHSAVFTNVTLLHCAQNLPQYQFTRDTVEKAIAAFSVPYADQNEKDHAAMKRAIREGKVKAVFELKNSRSRLKGNGGRGKGNLDPRKS